MDSGGLNWIHSARQARLVNAALGIREASGRSGAMPRSRLLLDRGCFEVSCLCTSNQESREVARRSVLVWYITASAAATSMSASVTRGERTAPMLARAVKCHPAKDKG